MDHTAQTIQLPDGRVLGFVQYGDLKGKPLFFFHGWPSTGIAAERFDALAGALHIRLIAPDRPGFGLSDFQKNRTLLDWPDDVIKLADALHIRKFSVVGVSGGGPYAAVCAYKIPERLIKAGIIVGLAPTFDWKFLKGMLFLEKIGWITYGKHAGIRKLSAIMQYIHIRYFSFLNLHRRFFAAASDQEVLVRTMVGQSVKAALKEAFRQGYNGPLQDLTLYTSGWGYDVSAIQTKTYLWYGTCDKNVSLAMGNYYHQRIKNSKMKIYEGEGHLLSVTHAEEILKTLA